MRTWKNAMIRLIAAAAIVTVAPIPWKSVEAGPTPDNSYETSTDAKKIAWMRKGLEAVKLKLKDPNSANFRNVYFNRGVDNVPLTCGEVNARNSFGGYGGFQRFISAGRPNLTFLESEVADINDLWRQLC